MKRFAHLTATIEIPEDPDGTCDPALLAIDELRRLLTVHTSFDAERLHIVDLVSTSDDPPSDDVQRALLRVALERLSDSYDMMQDAYHELCRIRGHHGPRVRPGVWALLRSTLDRMIEEVG